MDNQPKMKPLFSVLLFVFTAMMAHAQFEQRSVLGMSGGTSTVEVGDVSYTVSASVGQQGIIGTISNGEYTMRQGFQQPPIRVLAIPGAENGVETVVYPNPVNASVTVRFRSPVTSSIYSTLYDVQGRRIQHLVTAAVQSFEIDMASFATGTYILEIAFENQIFSTRLIKN